MSNKRENAEEDYITTPISVLRYITELETQLAEARELVFTAYQEGWNDNRNNLDCWETHWIDSDSRYSLEQLKEKGDVYNT
jgi:hypothetical protein